MTDTLLVSDGTLGEAVIAVCNDGSCWTISSLRYITMSLLNISLSLSSYIGIYNHFQQVSYNLTKQSQPLNILYPMSLLSILELYYTKHNRSQYLPYQSQHKLYLLVFTRYYRSHKQSVQKDCFDYVQYSIQVLRKRHLIPQVKVRAILTGR